MEFPSELRYTQSHEWARRIGNKIKIGITEHAQHEISDVVFVELPKIGTQTIKANAVAVVESVKAAFDIYAPVSGKVVTVNQALESEPALVNKEPYGQGWLFEIEMTNPQEWEELLKAEDYKNQCITTH